MQPTLRLASPSDAPILIEYVARYFAFDGLIFDESVENGIRDLLDHPEWGSAFLVEVIGQLAGYVVLTSGFDHEFGGRIAVVTDLFLDEPFRGHGVGPRIVDLVIQYAQEEGFKAIELFVLDHNELAKKMYERAGFEIAAGRHAMYKNLDLV